MNDPNSDISGTEERRKNSQNSAVNSLNLMYKSSSNRTMSSAAEFDRKCERIKKYLSRLKLNNKEESVNVGSQKKRFFPPLRLPSISIFNSLSSRTWKLKTVPHPVS